MSCSAYRRQSGCSRRKVGGDMFVGRKKELAQLQENFEKSENTVVVLYGREGMGKTALLKKFAKGKEAVYYLGRELSREEQRRYFQVALEQVEEKAKKGEKTAFFIDEFDVMQKGYKEFFEDLMAIVSRESWENRVMVVLASSSVQWVENQMVTEMGVMAARIDSFMKLKEFTFLEMVNRFPGISTQECITIYSILGGVPAYLDYWDEKKQVRENVVDLILKKEGVLRKEAARFLKTSLRELPFYNTILSVLAEGEPKLNYLYARTGFSRAKISVYIKNLIQMDVAEKYYSYEPKKKDTALKGLYGIQDRFLGFWYKFVFPEISQLEFGDPESFYDRFIEEELDAYVEMTYEQVCREFLMLMNQYGKLPAKFGKPETFYGKNGRIALVAAGTGGQFLVGTCKWGREPMGSEEFRELLARAGQLGQEADYYYLFSKEGFTNELSVMANGMDNIMLVDLDSL